MERMVGSWVVLLLLLAGVRSGGGLRCQDEAGEEVDWFLVYKLPEDPNSADEGFRRGAAYFFMTPRSAEGEWTRSGRLIQNPDSLLAMAIKPLLENRSEFGSVLYNDQPPEAHPVLFNGHTKGVVIADGGGGLWLQHSLPHFPNLDPAFPFYPPGGLENGQMFLCLSLELPLLDRLGEALELTKPRLFRSSIPPPLRPLLPRLTDVVMKNRTKTRAPWFTTIPLRAGNLNFTLFVKGPKFRRELFADWVGPWLGSSLEVQSWLNGRRPFPSNCTSALSVHNILEQRIGGQGFETHKDHSKWAVGTGKDKPWVCVADLNRMKAQKERGGLGLCLSHLALWTAMKTSVTHLQPCHTPNPPHPKKSKKRQHKT